MELMAVEGCPVNITNMQVENRLLPIKKKTIRHGIKKRIHPTLMLQEGMIVLQWVQPTMEGKFIAQLALVISRTNLETNFLTPSSLTISKS